MRIGFESYVGNLYRLGRISLREAARALCISQSEALDIFLDMGIKGNVDAADVIASLKTFVLEKQKAC